MAQQKKQDKRLLSAAIDFGTTFSSWAYSFRHSFESDPTDVSSKNWNDGSHISSKAPTTVLIRPDGRTLEAFGYDAETMYADLIEEKKHTQYYFFKQFKMVLYDQMSISSDIKIRDSLNKPLPALTVFSLAIEYLKNDLLTTINNRVDGEVTEKDITWVLTVPAIWTDSARMFMRKAAEQAGIRAENLKLALEPEVASLFCQNIRIKPQTKMQEGATEELLKLAPGTKYMVLDAGGGTIDITVHQVGQNGELNEVTKATGNALGGSKVNEMFHSIIAGVVGADIYEAFKLNHYEYFLDMDREFEVAKRKIGPDTDNRIRIKFPSILCELYRQEIGKELNDQLTRNITLKADKVILNPEASRELFRGAVDGITRHVTTLFADDKLKCTDIILMVGGFSECMMLNESIRKSFQDKKRIVPPDASLAVLKGAVIFGHDDKGITSRISKYTYEISSRHTFNPKVKPQSKRYVQSDGREMVRNVFSILVHAGETVVPGEPCQPQVFFPSEGGHTGFTLKLFASPRPDPQYVDEPDCIQIGEVMVDCRDRYGRVGGAAVSLMFGGTEIQVSAVNELTKEITEAKFTTI